MLAKSVQSRTWSNQGYVCLACRQQQALRVNRHQIRGNRTEAASHRVTDDDIFALNDISDTYGRKAPKPKDDGRTLPSVESQASSAQSTGKSREEEPGIYRPFLAGQGSREDTNGDSIRQPPRSVSRKARRLLANAARSTSSPKSVRASKASVAATTRPDSEEASQILENDIDSLLRQLQPALQQSKPSARPTSRDDIQTLLDGLRPGLQEALKQKAAAADKEAEQSEGDAVESDSILKQDSSADPKEAEQGDGDVAKLDSELNAKLVEQSDALSDVPRGNSVEEPASSASSFGWRQGLKYIKDTLWSNSEPEDTATVRTPTRKTKKSADPVEAVVAAAVKTRLPLKPYTSLVQNPSRAAKYSIVDQVDALKARPKFGGNTNPSMSASDVFYFDSFGKKEKHKVVPSAIASHPYGLPEALARAQAINSARMLAESKQPDVQSLAADLNDGTTAVSYKSLPADSSTTKAADGRPLRQLSGLYETRMHTRSTTGDTSNGHTGGISVFKDYLSSQPKVKDDVPHKATGVTIEQAMAAPQVAPKQPGPRIRFSAPRQPNHQPEPVRSATSTSAKSKTSRSDAGAGRKSGAGGAPPADDPPPDIKTSTPKSLEIKPLEMPQPAVPLLAYGLDRVLFNPGVYQLQDSASRVYNFDPYLQNIMPIVEFDFDSLKEYKTSSKDEILVELARNNKSKYIGSTSSMTSSLAHFHQLLSNWRPLNLAMLSQGFVTPTLSTQLTQINRAPSAIFLRWKNGTYAIDADKEHDSANVLMLLGKSMELLLTQPKSEYERYRKSDPRKIPDEERLAPETYQYTTMRDFLMRSQLDAHDSRLPGSGNFDLKTRAVVTVRMQSHDPEEMTGYELLSNQGRWFSYEKEYYDMMRSTMLKYMLQARMGRMNGIFVAYHNVERIFGFQYVPMADMDMVLHGQTDPTLGDQEFRASLDLMNEVLNKATAKYPETSLRIHFETMPAKSGMPTSLHIFAEPMTEDEIDAIQNKKRAKIAEFERSVMGKEEPSIDEAIDEAAKDAQTASSSRSEDEAAAEATSGQDVEHNDEVQAKSAAEGQDESINSTEEDEASSYARSLITNTSDSPADTQFLDAISTTSTSTTPDPSLRPLFYATVIIQSTVNGRPPDDSRPTHLTPDDNWEIDYILKEYTITPHVWALYNDMKARRRFATSSREDADDPTETLTPEEEKMQKRSDGYLQMLRSLSEKGRRLRREVDERDEGREVVRVEEKVERGKVEIESVDDYLRWMCGKGR